MRSSSPSFTRTRFYSISAGPLFDSSRTFEFAQTVPLLYENSTMNRDTEEKSREDPGYLAHSAFVIYARVVRDD